MTVSEAINAAFSGGVHAELRTHIVKALRDAHDYESANDLFVKITRRYYVGSDEESALHALFACVYNPRRGLTWDL